MKRNILIKALILPVIFISTACFSQNKSEAEEFFMQKFNPDTLNINKTNYNKNNPTIKDSSSKAEVFFKQKFDSDTISSNYKESVELSTLIVREERRISRDDLSLSEACDWMYYCEEVHPEWYDDWEINGNNAEEMCSPAKN